MATRGPGTLCQYLHRLYYPAIRRDVDYLVQRELSAIPPLQAAKVTAILQKNDCVDFLAQFYIDAFISRFAERLFYFSYRQAAHDIYPFENVVHDSLKALVEKQIQRLLDENS